jgi:hypothetical protein
MLLKEHFVMDISLVLLFINLACVTQVNQAQEATIEPATIEPTVDIQVRLLSWLDLRPVVKRRIQYKYALLLSVYKLTQT